MKGVKGLDQKYICSDTSEDGINDYMNRACGWLRSINKGEILPDGRNLRDVLEDYEKNEIKSYVITLATDYAKPLFSFRIKNIYSVDHDDMYQDFELFLIENLENFNCPDYVAKYGKKYRFYSFITNMIKCSIRMSFSDFHGVKTRAEQDMVLIRKTIKKISIEKEIPEEDVDPLMIQEKLDGYSVDRINDYLHLIDSYDKPLSYDQCYVESNLNNDPAEIIELEDLMNSINEDALNTIKDFLNNKSKVQLYFLLVTAGITPRDYVEETYKEMSTMDYTSDPILFNIYDEEVKNNSYCRGLTVETDGKNRYFSLSCIKGQLARARRGWKSLARIIKDDNVYGIPEELQSYWDKITGTDDDWR